MIIGSDISVFKIHMGYIAIDIVGGEKVFPLVFSVNLYLRVKGVTLRP